jgi:hypothetical protein
VRGQSVLLDSDVAELYRIETKRINEAVKNNPDKFPHDYMFEITEGEFTDLRSKFSTTKFAKTRSLPKAFTEKGLYMIATILKSKQVQKRVRNHRDFRKNQTAIKKHSGAIGC